MFSCSHLIPYLGHLLVDPLCFVSFLFPLAWLPALFFSSPSPSHISSTLYFHIYFFTMCVQQILVLLRKSRKCCNFRRRQLLHLRTLTQTFFNPTSFSPALWNCQSAVTYRDLDHSTKHGHPSFTLP